MVRQISKFSPKKIVLFDQAETPLYDLELELKENLHFYDFESVIGSVTNDYRVNKLFDVFKPNVVFHAAAYKHVPMMENNPTEAVFNNVLGTKLIAETAVRYGVEKFVMISTDKAVNPTNVMGASKRIAEIFTQSLSCQVDNQLYYHAFWQRAWFKRLGYTPFQKTIEKGGPVTITHPKLRDSL